MGDLLIDKKLISQEQFEVALAEQKKSGHKLGQVLVEKGFLTEEAMLQTLAEQRNLPYVDISTFELDPDLVRRLPEIDARRYHALVLKETTEGLLVGMGDPDNIFHHDALVAILKQPVQVAAVKQSDLLQQIDQIYQRGEQLQALVTEVGEDLGEHAFDLDKLITGSSTSDAPVVRLIQTMFESTVSADATDIHIEPGENILRIRRRIDGMLFEQIVDDKRIAAAMISRLKLMADADISEHRLPQEGRFSIAVHDKKIDVRLATIPTQNGESVVMRLLDHGGNIRKLDNAGMPDGMLATFRKIIHKPHGLILVTGPTGSGKTTTLFGALTELNTPQKKIITIEDPIEYRLPRVNQVQVNTKIGLTFAAVLRASLRLDPDIILIGEIRDQETGEIGLRAALTGHLVMSTLHTNDAVSSAVRLIDMGLESYLLASSVQAILAQRLIRRVCPNCSTTATLDANELAWLRSQVGEAHDDIQFRYGAGCNLCNQTGFRGRVGVYELMVMEGDLAEALRRNDLTEFQHAAHAQAGYKPLTLNALDYASQGVTTVSEVMRLSGWVE